MLKPVYKTLSEIIGNARDLFGVEATADFESTLITFYSLLVISSNVIESIESLHSQNNLSDINLMMELEASVSNTSRRMIEEGIADAIKDGTIKHSCATQRYKNRICSNISLNSFLILDHITIVKPESFLDVARWCAIMCLNSKRAKLNLHFASTFFNDK
jgi:hypothetical protein